MADPFDLARFTEAQSPVIADVLAELEAGRKRSHWMWFVFPQYQSLGHSAMAQRYAIASLDEARAYLGHPLLGPRLHACCKRLQGLPTHSATEVFGTPDDLKLQSCMTLFAEAATSAAAKAPFEEVLAKFYAGQRDAKTVALLR